MTGVPEKLNVGRNRSAREALDAMLMREALKALETAEPLIASLVFSGSIKRRGIDTAQAHQATRIAITKLEQRLLKE